MLNNFSKVFPTVCKKKKGATQSQSTFVKLFSEVMIAFLVCFFIKTEVAFFWGYSRYSYSTLGIFGVFLFRNSPKRMHPECAKFSWVHFKEQLEMSPC